MYCPCSEKHYINIKQHRRTQRHLKYIENKHWMKILFEPDADDPPTNYQELASRCRDIYLDILLEGINK